MPNKDLQEFVGNNREAIEKWLKVRPSVGTEGRSTYDDLLNAINSGELKVKYIPKDEWKSHIRSKNMQSAGGYYSKGRGGKPDYIYTTKDRSAVVMPHEAMHFYASHRPNSRGTPKWINPYIKADMKLGGWLPSFHPGGRRPHIGGKLGETSAGNWWNKNKATKHAAYSNESKPPYHPWFDEHAFNTVDKEVASVFGNKSNVGSKLNSIRNKVKNIFKKDKSFGETFRSARDEGLKEFEWKDKKYHTKYKEEMKPKEENFLDNWKKSWAFRGSNY